MRLTRIFIMSLLVGWLASCGEPFDDVHQSQSAIFEDAELLQVKQLAKEMLAQSNIQFQAKERKQFEQMAKDGTTIDGYRITKGVYTLLRHWLDTKAKLFLISLTRVPKPGKPGGPHGRSATKLTHAVDVGRFGTNIINIKNVSQSRQATVDLIQSLPNLKFDIGFLRAPYNPDTEKSKFSNDCMNYAGNPIFNSDCTGLSSGYTYSQLNVYLDPQYNETSPLGNFDSDLNHIINPVVEQEVRDAVNASAASFGMAYADALDHVHMTVVSDPQPAFGNEKSALFMVRALKASIKETKKTGEAWDVKKPWDEQDVTYPDPYVEIWVNGYSEGPAVYVSQKDSNTINPYWDTEESTLMQLNPDDRLYFEVWDQDLVDPDRIGACETKPIGDLVSSLGKITLTAECIDEVKSFTFQIDLMPNFVPQINSSLLKKIKPLKVSSRITLSDK